jgi:UPF0755 protein
MRKLHFRALKKQAALLRKTRTYALGALLGIVVLAGLFTIVYFPLQNEAPRNFTQHRQIVIEEGLSTKEIVRSLQEQGVIRSPFAFSIFLALHFNDAYIQAGSYTFDRPLTSLEIAEAITSGLYMTPPIKITIPEGFRASAIRAYLPQKYRNADISKIGELEGYLFPDTYYIDEDTTFEEILELMRENFARRTAPLLPEIEKAGLTLEEVVILASILEKEGNNEESMRTIAGILHSRLYDDMPLQVDATFYYTIGKTSAELTRADLRSDSPYNTYTNKGLPAGPIANPGLTAMKAVLDPIPSNYYYYLTGANGIFYYAETHDEHVSNKYRYLQ